MPKSSDDLYLRYMAAFKAATAHLGGCTACQTEHPCVTGQQLYESFARLQDAYNNRLRQRS
ncbi:hypothetical protein [Streptomyces agglomeratus]|uniref:hypothetical protein n=1 Tax=Streptomyces agglomeratus TaxID=285458 RepID=UPI00085482CA|nr:hypothetical protein [Streptomyces agglomeratus]OEJ36328.1 hypothetical protein BGK72_38880 [Streptomyces agglomeratus]